MRKPNKFVEYLIEHADEWVLRKDLMAATGGHTVDKDHVSRGLAAVGFRLETKVVPNPSPQFNHPFTAYRAVRGRQAPPRRIVPKPQLNGHLLLGEQLKVIGLIAMPGDQEMTVMALRPDGTTKELRV